jgi:para-nitrobenzyl esterase
MCDALASVWVNFAKTGDPANQFIPDWPRFESNHRSTMVFGERTRAVNDAYGEIRAFWLDMPGPSSMLG